ncbi:MULTISPECIES: LLM class flavin-dependent oxidoreductase [unclassified Pseudonocardia]|uniref:LLM class flavin-dependent oxidoreductase n=1 Tax=unclassified Pseudonocardia TaxID=2619320 RepID=UPI0001FFDDEA|nr:LLM class flavin-dependent oxidoreductase [Pseudonocardia sp. Ae707_Ps1]OLM16787.1 Phthiodiolone/phenolphthiodiolone dimycocerosates ketoreductase [Pseudonocardia sp. Ae707_Ps1]
MAKDIRTGIGIWASRFLDPTGAADSARALQATGQVDQFVLWDQMTSWWPNSLWTPENTPLADQIPDMDSLQDPFATAAFALAGVDRLGFAVCTDATRREPPELAQTMLTLAMATRGRASLCLGAGEVRHISPFGRKRSQGLKRLDETFQILRLLLKEHGLVDYEGDLWNLRDAWVGNAGKDRRPEVIAMGGGPKLTDMALRHADGFGTGAPFVYADADAYSSAIGGHRRTLGEIGRDPDDFTFALHHIVFVLDEDDDFERYVDNPMLKWYAATGGRLNMADWQAEGIDPVMPLDWHYALHMKPNSMSLPEVMEIVDQVTPEMVRKTFFHGTPEQIAAQITPYVQAGAQLNLIADLAPLLIPTDPAKTVEASAEICRLVKQA